MFKTGSKKKSQRPMLRQMGKSGTAQVRGEAAGKTSALGRKSRDLVWSKIVAKKKSAQEKVKASRSSQMDRKKLVQGSKKKSVAQKAKVKRSSVMRQNWLGQKKRNAQLKKKKLIAKSQKKSQKHAVIGRRARQRSAQSASVKSQFKNSTRQSGRSRIKKLALKRRARFAKKNSSSKKVLRKSISRKDVQKNLKTQHKKNNRTKKARKSSKKNQKNLKSRPTIGKLFSQAWRGSTARVKRFTSKSITQKSDAVSVKASRHIRLNARQQLDPAAPERPRLKLRFKAVQKSEAIQELSLPESQAIVETSTDGVDLAVSTLVAVTPQSDAVLSLGSEQQLKSTLAFVASSGPESSAIAQVVIPPILTETSEKAFLTLQDLVRPNDLLRNSIEAFLLDQRSPHTRRAYGKDLKRFVLFLNARKNEVGKNGPMGGLEKLTRSVLIAYKESLLSQQLEHTTVDRHIATLRSFFNWLVDDGLLIKSPADGVRFMNPKRLSTTRGFSDDEVRKVLTYPDLHTRTGSQHYAILMVLFYCGLRRSELCELRTRHITNERNQNLFRLRGKGNKERMIVIIPAVWNAISHYLLIAGRSLSSDDYLFKPMRNNRTGVLKKALDPSMIFYIVTRYAKKAGITARVSPHSCRSTAISNARDHQVPDRAIQEFAGWASPDMITRYDKRKTSIENSAAHSIHYGSENRPLPIATEEEAVKKVRTPGVLPKTLGEGSG